MRIRIDLRGESCFFLALLCLILPVNWILAIVFAGLFHELCHVMAVLLAGGDILGIRIGLRGTIMEISEMTPWREFVCALAGPAGSMILFMFAEYIPYPAICALIHGLYNLLPIYPLDGGRMLCCILKMRYPQEKALRISVMVNRISGIFLILCMILAAVRTGTGIMPAIVVLIFLSGVMNEKYLAKMAFSGYNRVTL